MQDRVFFLRNQAQPIGALPDSSEENHVKSVRTHSCQNEVRSAALKVPESSVASIILE